LEEALNALRAQLANAEMRAESAENRANEAQKQANGLRERLEVLQVQLVTAEMEAKAANDRAWVSGEAQAASERRAEAERARADRAESSAVHERQDFLDAESRTRRELEAVKREVEQARDAIEALQQAEADRQARGRWARLRAAWRGE
jgi:hypothetical protein